jgi:glycerol kinase
MCQSILEGIALRTAEVISAMDSQVSLAPALSVDGGLARNVYFVQFLSDVLGRTVTTQRFDELTSYGCASLAALGLGVTLPEYRNTTTMFQPQYPQSVTDGWKTRFADAVARAKAWS